MSRDLDVQYKTAFVLSHKLREAMQLEAQGRVLDGVVEVDGAYSGGYVKPANIKSERADRRLRMTQSGKRQSVVVIRERNGDTNTMVGKSEAVGVAAVVASVALGAIIHTDEASHWDALHGRYEAKRINHSKAYSLDGAAPIRLRAFSAACVARRLVFITISQGRT
ncbi:hypothetical protein ACVWZA_000992 [Sphingomonas sp. UYAg733]